LKVQVEEFNLFSNISKLDIFQLIWILLGGCLTVKN
jgi:hypothetical protein